ncbi:MAG: hypothetical protein ACKOKB_00730, partial [Bacteroidota bacterium]
ANLQTLSHLKHYRKALKNKVINTIFGLVTQVIACFYCLVGTAIAQPYFDVAGVQYWNSPASMHADSVGEQSFTASISLPLNVAPRFKLIFSPAYEQRLESGSGLKDPWKLEGLALPLNFVFYAADSTRMLSVTAINRFNGYSQLLVDDGWQLGGAVVGSKRFGKKLWLRLGAYYNNEFFGGYFLPLAGIDWRISVSWRLFGLLPSNMRLQHRLSERCNAGLSFKSSKGSYLNPQGGYVKLYDNQLYVYADCRLISKLVLVAEVGHSAFRTISKRGEGAEFQLQSDGPIIKCGLFYRIPQP